MTSDAGALPDHDDLKDVRRSLLAFFDEHARALPWRENSQAYRVWVSEIMLQQTRVETVIPYYERWMERFPTATALAQAPLESVLEAWAGLGYYSRARNLHRAASVVRERHNGTLPHDPGELRALPGIGEYTAGAIGSIAFGQTVPAVDGNVRRVLSRLFDLPAPTPAQLRTYASALVDPERPGDFNQALMELGATVCKPRQPNCPKCPVATKCLALARDTVQERPPVKTRKPVPTQAQAVVVIRFATNETGDGLSTVLRQRPNEGLLGGMLEFPSVSIEAAGPRGLDRKQVISAATELLSSLAQVRASNVSVLEPVRHRFSHLEITYHPVVFDLEAGPMGPYGASGTSTRRTLGWTELEAAALPAAQRRIARASEALEWRGHRRDRQTREG